MLCPSQIIKLSCVVLGGVLLTEISCAQPSFASKVDPLIAGKVVAGRFNGAVLVADGREVIYRRAFGYADLLSKEKLSPEYRFNVGSIGKEFSAAAVALLAREGKLSYDDKLPRFKLDLPGWSQHITVRNLLNYSSGLPATPSGIKWGPDITNDIFFKLLREERSLCAEPGKGYEYSSYSPFLAAQIVERASGQAFSAFVTRAVLQPAGMKQTEFEQSMSSSAPRRSKSFDASAKRDFFPVRVTYPLIYTNVDDMMSWAISLRTASVLTRDELEILTTPQAWKLESDGYTAQQTSFGNTRREGGTLTQIRHQGSHLNFRSMFFVDFCTDVTVVLLTTHTDAEEMDDVFERIRDLATLPARSTQRCRS